MAQRLEQKEVQIQQQLQKQLISQLQSLHTRLLYMSMAELEERIQAELDDNPALDKDFDEQFEELPSQSGGEDGDYSDNEDGQSEDDELGFDEQKEREDELNEVLDRMDADDELLYENPHTYSPDDDDKGIVFGQEESFYDNLHRQLEEMILTEREHLIMEYLIGSLESDGLLHKQLDFITDELAIYHYIDVSEEELKGVISKLQTFEPTGIGATSLQECLRLQILKKSDKWLKANMLAIVDDYFEEFMKKHWDTIQSELGLNDEQREQLQKEMQRLNPKPGSAMGETTGRSIEQITPDIIVETDDNNRITFYINDGRLPNLIIADDFEEGLKMYNDIPDKSLSASDLEAKKYYKKKIGDANIFILALRQRRKTIESVMKIIIQRQRKFFLEGDDSELSPMKLADIAEKTSLDISTISRACSKKYIETQWGIYPMKFFFSQAHTNDDGEEMSVKKVKAKLEDIINAEDKKHPLSDDDLAKKMSSEGFKIARRTVTKYREQMNIPVARLRKQ